MSPRFWGRLNMAAMTAATNSCSTSTSVSSWTTTSSWLSLRLDLSGLVGRCLEQEFGGFRGDLSHLGDEGAVASVVGDPFLVELGLALGEPTIDGLAVDLRGPLPVRAM